jgi:DNA processing protein
MPDPLAPEARDLLALHLVPGVGPRLAAALLERFGDATGVLRAPRDELTEVPRVGPDLAGRIAAALDADDLRQELEELGRSDVRLIGLGTPDYPAGLAEIPDPPPLLYCRGAVTAADAEAVALVGSRHGTEYGRRAAARLAAGLARAGVCVVSGLARGVDGAAHRAALEASGRTLAVLANGLATVYPPEHKGLAAQVAAAGAVLSESRMRQAPERGLFPARNRIISGLARVVVVVEAGERSGALLTASHAAEQGRTVMAVPGPVDGESSAGCHALIRDGAVLARGVDDVLEELRGASAVASGAPAAAAAPAAAPAEPPPGLDEAQRRVWDALAGGPRTFDELAQQLGAPAPALSTALLMMEMKKAVRRLPGNRYERPG